MPEPWSEFEIESIVSDYFSMLDCELRGQKYSKTEHRKTLLESLTSRQKGAVEKKHQNISAILLENGLPYIDGYKPLHNYQVSLKHLVMKRISDPVHAQIMGHLADDPAPQIALPDNINHLLVPIPKPLPKNSAKTTIDEIDPPRMGLKIDYARREAANRLLGKQGEEFVLKWEIERLRQNGHPHLAQKVEWVSEVQGDGLGFDISSFDVESGESISIEVKTTRGGQYNPFFVTQNEAQVSEKLKSSYRLYRLYRFAIEPRLFIVPGPLDASLILEPYLYRASLYPEPSP